MKLIFGLGNPGKKYSDTKHNIGFISLDEIAFQQGLTFNKSKFESVYAEGNVGSEKLLLIKPQTFMNESGRSVRPWMDYYDLDLDDILVIYDDMDLPAGKIRLRQKGSSGGHNGIRSIITHVGTKEFNRIKVGIDRPYPKQTVVSHVLSKFPKEVKGDVEESLKKVSDAALYWSEGHPFPETMSKFN